MNRPYPKEKNYTELSLNFAAVLKSTLMRNF